jgi:starch phosphorylase
VYEQTQRRDGYVSLGVSPDLARDTPGTLARVETTADQHVFQILVYLGELDPDAVQVDLYANSPNGAAPLRLGMTRGERLSDANGHVYSARVPGSHAASDYTARIIPHHLEAAVPLEAA